ncbi:lysophospholipid acyltransferase family protein [Hyalangium gracile]|uniref:lysophospholipid acyltransferase family protein n=1 Tax=Hyalangium gracile TaxID=394092 RepID=UPI001CCAF023|nr:lysophospholipid acyltransferase family protein [Hyalangium gracile]
MSELLSTARQWSHRWLQRLLTPELELLRFAAIQDAGHGYDLFGLEPRHVAVMLALLGRIHEHYFRVTAHGVENIPARGPAILASNHSGTLPFDATMIWTDVLLRRGRIARAVADYFVAGMPFVGTLFARCGVVGGTPGNLRVLLESGELVMLFPEGVPGISKPIWKRYQLQEWREGHAELALRHRVPVVPVAVIGAEEQMPLLGRLETLGSWIGVPHIPVPLTPIPLPVRYHIHYGEPLVLHEGLEPEDADDPDVVKRASSRVREAVQELIARGLRQRQGLFR